VVAVERRELSGRSDRVRFAAAPGERRAIATRDLGDFRPLLAEAIDAGIGTYGLVCVPRRFSVRRAGIGRLVDAFAELLQTHPEDDAVIKRGGEVWLREPQP
jgi:hypothetical protein